MNALASAVPPDPTGIVFCLLAACVTLISLAQVAHARRVWPHAANLRALGGLCTIGWGLAAWQLNLNGAGHDFEGIPLTVSLALSVLALHLLAGRGTSNPAPAENSVFLGGLLLLPLGAHLLI